MAGRVECAEGLLAPLGTHEAGRLPQSLAWPGYKPAGYLRADPTAYGRCPSLARLNLNGKLSCGN